MSGMLALALALSLARSAPRDALEAMHDVDLAAELRKRVYTLQSPPGRVRGALKNAMAAGLADVQRDPGASDGWKLFLLAPRMLLHRRRGETRIQHDELDRRVALLAAGQCCSLLESATAAAADEPHPNSRGHASANNDSQRRAERAAALAHLGEFSATSAALTASPMAPATRDTLRALRDPDRRPPQRQVPLPDGLRDNLPAPLALCRKRFLQNVRGSRRGAAAGPSGRTAEALRVLVDDEASAELLFRAAEQLATAAVPPPVLAGVRLGRMVGLQKPDGGVRALFLCPGCPGGLSSRWAHHRAQCGFGRGV